MEMASSAISGLPHFVRRRDLLLDVNGVFGRLSLSRYGYSDLASPDQSWIVSHGCREEVCPRNIYPGYYVFGNGDSFSRLPTTSTKWFGYLSLEYQWWCSCRCCLINLMAACVHKALALRLKIKKGRTFGGIHSVVWWCWRCSTAAFRKVKDCVMDEERAWRSHKFASLF